MAKMELKVVYDKEKLQELIDEAEARILNDDSVVIQVIEHKHGSGKALLVSQILNADEQTIERVLKELEK